MNDTPSQADVETLLAADGFASTIGATYASSNDGWHMELVVAEKHCNFLGGVHGAVLFGLADLAMGLMSNAETSVALAVEASISFVRGAKPGDVLRTTVTPVRQTRSLGWFQIDITNQVDDLVASFRGTVYRPDPH